MIDPLQLVTAVVQSRHDTMGQDKQRATILVKNLETLVSVSPFQMFQLNLKYLHVKITNLLLVVA